MPAPVSTARQCLSAEAIQALDEAVNVAKHRGHGQTTSLHAVSALLSLPSSQLRDACLRARNSVCSRLQFKALELCLSVSLDRVPSSGETGSDPPVSNSLMAAIKRSQANQRRQPERYHYYPHQSHSSYSSFSATSTAACVKVNLRNLTLSILDDPVVSRVFGESGFRSSDVKLALLRLLPSAYRFPRLKGFRQPPIFLWDVDHHQEGPAMATQDSANNWNWKVIGDVLVRDKRNNPILAGPSAADVLHQFCNFVNGRREMTLPPLLISGLRIINLSTQVRRFLCSRDKESLFHEVSNFILLEDTSVGVALNIGDLNAFLKESSELEGVKDEDLGYLISEVATLLSSLKRCSRKVWIMGSLDRYEMYLKLVTRFPAVEMDWDLQILPVPSSRKCSLSDSCPKSRYHKYLNYYLTGKSYSKKSRSLFESFVPFRGLLSTPSACGTPSFHPPSLFEEKGHEEQAISASPWPVATEIGQKVALNIADCIPIYVIVNFSFLCSAQAGDGLRLQTEPTCVSLRMVTEEEPDRETLSKRITFHDSPSQVSLLTCYPSNKYIHNQMQTMDQLAFSCSSTFLCEWDFKKLFNFLTERVNWQDEAVSEICHLLTKGIHRRNGTWFHFLGPDKLGKEKIAAALAEIRCGTSDSIFNVDFSSQNNVLRDLSDVATRGKTLVDCIANELKKKPPYLIFLQDIDMADVQTQSALSSAVLSGKFSDSHGREVVVNNAVFVTTTATSEDELASSFSEKRIRRTKCRSLQIVIERSPDDLESTIPHIVQNPVIKSDSFTNLDLNLPAEGWCESNNSFDCSATWLQEYLNLVDKIQFKPFDFDAIATKLSYEIGESFRKIAGTNSSLKIDSSVMQQLIAAAYMSEKKRAVEDWVDQVLGWGFVQAVKKFNPGSNSVFRIVSSQESQADEQFQPGVLLPKKIILKSP